jgi:hypothetical protein
MLEKRIEKDELMQFKNISFRRIAIAASVFPTIAINSAYAYQRRDYCIKAHISFAYIQ